MGNKEQQQVVMLSTKYSTSERDEPALEGTSYHRYEMLIPGTAARTCPCMEIHEIVRMLQIRTNPRSRSICCGYGEWKVIRVWWI
jgi:hypothetical protein